MTFARYLALPLMVLSLAACLPEKDEAQKETPAPAAPAGQAARLDEATRIYNCGEFPLIIRRTADANVLSVDLGGYKADLVRDETGDSAPEAEGRKPAMTYVAKEGEQPLAFKMIGQRRALLRYDGTLYPECFALSTVPWRGKGAYRALGNEPGWIVSIDGEKMELVLDYGAKKAELATPPAQKLVNSLYFQTEYEGKKLTLEIMHDLCQDDSGRYLPDTTMLQIGDDVFRGCGGAISERPTE